MTLAGGAAAIDRHFIHITEIGSAAPALTAFDE